MLPHIRLSVKGSRERKAVSHDNLAQFVTYARTF